MENQPLISIALCTYNGEKFLKEQLDSIFAQTYTNIEVIAVDDCSSDNTVKILEEYKNTGKLKIYSNETNLGYKGNFEKAISLCNGDYIALSDQDDIWLNTKLEVLLNNIKDNILIYADSELIDGQGNLINKKISTTCSFVKGHTPEAFLFYNCIAGHTMLFKRELKKYIFPFPENFFHDWWIAFVASSLSTITYTTQCLVKYRQHDTAVTDMMRLRTPRIKETNKSNKVEQNTLAIISRISVYYQLNCLNKQDKDFIKALIDAYQDRLNASIYSFKLFLFLFKNRKVLYYIPKDSASGTFFYILKESYGTKLKKRFYLFKETYLKK